MNSILRWGLNKILNTLGLEIHKVHRDDAHRFDHTFNRIQHLKKLGFYPDIIFDVGASNGRWTRKCLEIYPEAQFFCFEPLEENKPALTSLCIDHSNVNYWQGCLGSKQGSAILNADGSGSSILNGHIGNPYGTQVESNVETLDNLIQQKKYLQPDLIKLDVQGYELEILKGAMKTLKNVQAIIAEISFFSFQEGMPILHEVVGQLSTYGFVAYDILSVNIRPLDNAPGQTDMLFLKENHFLRDSNKWGRDSTY